MLCNHAERPILFSAPMVRAILDGRKSQTRRVIKPQPEERLHGIFERFPHQEGCPYGKPGDRLWVRETFCRVDDTPVGGEEWIDYRATPRYESSHPAGWENDPSNPQALKWKSPIHMPRWASRITLEITDVRAQRVQDISEEDAKAESIVTIGRSAYKHGLLDGYGVAGTDPADAQTSRVYAFKSLWDSIHPKEHRWADNDPVWVVGFLRIEP